MKRFFVISILLLSVMQLFARPNLIGRWQTAPLWERFEKSTWELNFKDTLNFETKVVVDNTNFTEGELTTYSLSGTYLLQDSLCILNVDPSSFTAMPANTHKCDISDIKGADVFVILPSNHSEDMIALIDRSKRNVYVLYRQK